MGEYLDNNYSMIEDVRNSTIYEVTFAFLYSYIIFFIVLICFRKIDLREFHLTINKKGYSANIIFIYFLILFMILYLCYIIYITEGNLPIILFINGFDSMEVNILKASFLTDKFGIKIPYFDSFIKLLFPFSTLFILNLIYLYKATKHLIIL
jgi:hypothetical protein